MAQNEAPVATVSENNGTNVAENVNVVANAEETVSTTEETSEVSYKNVIKNLIAAGCKRINSIRIKNVNTTDKENYTMVSFTLDTAIRGYISTDGGVSYQEGKTNTLFTSSYAIVGAMKEDEELSWMANALLANPTAFNLILNGSRVDIVQQEVAAGEEYVNPFSTRTDIDPQVYDHDIIINHIIGFKLGKSGLKMADRLADKLMGF